MFNHFYIITRITAVGFMCRSYTQYCQNVVNAGIFGRCRAANGVTNVRDSVCYKKINVIYIVCSDGTDGAICLATYFKPPVELTEAPRPRCVL